MLGKLTDFALRNQFVVVLLFVILVGVGVRSAMKLPVDAFPDTTPVQVQINTVAVALNPEEIEQQITNPVELAIAGIPGLANVRSISKFGLSQVVATFDDSVNIYSARQFIQERLGSVELPDGIERPQLGPISTGLGEVFHYIVRSNDPNRTLDEIRTIHDWVIKPELRKVAGVAEVNSWGGHERQYHVIVSPDSLIKYGLTFESIFEALERNNRNVGGGQIVSSGQSFLVHGIGRVATVDQVANIVIRSHAGTPIRIRDVADVAIGHEIRQGAVTAEGKGEAVLGLGFMLMGENSKEVTEKLRAQLDATRKSLPPDIILETVYDRTELVQQVIGTATHNLLLGAVLVIAALFLFMGNLRAGLLVAASIPLTMLFTIIGMDHLAIAASLLSLGAVDFGIVIDGSIVIADLNMRRLVEAQRRLGRALTADERFEVVRDSTREVARPVAFGMGVIMIVFFPILTLQGIEGKMFRPMALTFILALLGALLVAIFLTPILSHRLLPRKLREKESILERALKAIYTPILNLALRARWAVFILAAALVAPAALIGLRLGGEFIPRLSEGAIVSNIIRLAGVSIEHSAEYNTRIEKLLLQSFPDEIAHIWSRIGTAEVATDPMGIELTDIFMSLHPRERWKRAGNQAELTALIEKELQGLPGLTAVCTQPIEMRLNEMISGIRSDIGIKVYGDDFDRLVELSDRVQRVLQAIPGAADVTGEQITGQPLLQIVVDQDRAARYGLSARDPLDLVQAVSSHRVGEVFEGQRHFPLVVRLPDEQRTNVQALAETLIPTDGGPLLPLRMVADIRETEGPSTINREWGRRLIKVQCNVRGRDVASFVKEAQERVAENVRLPEGYLIEWGGQFENLQRSKVRLAIVVPVTLGLIFMLLCISLKSARDVLIIYTGIPFAAVGGIFALAARGMPFSVSAAIGFIAISGLAVLDGQVLVSGIRAFLQAGLPLRDAIVAAGRERLRPVLSTTITDMAGFLPMAFSVGVGAEVQRPLATVLVFGVCAETTLTLLVLPALYHAIARRGTKE